jgi:hypothetical protein
MLRRLVAILILCCLIYFPIGYLAVSCDWISLTVFLAAGSGVGAIASIVSLISFIRPPITRQDVKNLDWESVRVVATRSKEIEELEDEKKRHVSEIDDLSKRKIEMEDLVRRASMELFLRDRLADCEKEVASSIKSQERLRHALETHRETTAKLRELEIEIENHPDIDLLNEIVSEVSRPKRDYVSEAVYRAKRLRLLA